MYLKEKSLINFGLRSSSMQRGSANMWSEMQRGRMQSELQRWSTTMYYAMYGELLYTNLRRSYMWYDKKWVIKLLYKANMQIRTWSMLSTYFDERKSGILWNNLSRKRAMYVPRMFKSRLHDFNKSDVTAAVLASTVQAISTHISTVQGK